MRELVGVGEAHDRAGCEEANQGYTVESSDRAAKSSNRHPPSQPHSSAQIRIDYAPARVECAREKHELSAMRTRIDTASKILQGNLGFGDDYAELGGALVDQDDKESL